MKTFTSLPVRGLTIFLFLTLANVGESQQPVVRVLVYDLSVHAYVDTLTFQRTTILPHFSNTASNPGLLPGRIVLPQSAPQDEEAIPGTEFSEFINASARFQIDNYPIRTNAVLRVYNQGEWFECGCQMVEKNMAVTYNGCLFNLFSGEISTDSVFIFAVNEDKQFPDHTIQSRVRFIFLIESDLQAGRPGFALIGLTEPIGEFLGWSGLAFSTREDFYDDKVFHKFSYPDDSSHPFEGNLIGDSLYYQYGKVMFRRPGVIGVNSGIIHNLWGQAGFPLFYSDPIHTYVIGMPTYSHNFQHAILSPDEFYAWKRTMELYASLPKYHEGIGQKIALYPNPSGGRFKILFDNPGKIEHEFLIYDVLGRLLLSVSGIRLSSFEIDAAHFVPGTYIYVLGEHRGVVSSGKIVLNSPQE